MRKFGLELRKTGNVNNLFADVDLVLKKAGIKKNDVSSIEMQTVALALQDMIDGGRFSVCTIDKCMKVAGVIVSAKRYAIYRAVHCIHWNEMDNEYRKTIIAMVLDDFRDILNPQPEDCEVIEITP